MQASSIRSERRAVLTAIAIPLAILAVAYGMWWVSDRMLTIGPFDRATFGWTFVIPTWLAAPVVAGFVWRDAPTRVVAIAGAVIVAVLSVASSYLIWRATTPDCSFGAIASADRFAASAVVGGSLAVGIVASSLATRLALRGGLRGRAIAIGLSASLVAFVVTTAFAVLLLSDPVCNRPPALA